MPDLRSLGREAEDRAAAYLLGLGYTLVTRRYTVKGGEIDIVALDGDTLVFVEVKLRLSPGLTPEESVDWRKTKRLQVAADAYTFAMGESERPIRFDLIAIDGDGLRHHKDFFRPGL